PPGFVGPSLLVSGCRWGGRGFFFGGWNWRGDRRRQGGIARRRRQSEIGDRSERGTEPLNSGLRAEVLRRGGDRALISLGRVVAAAQGFRAGAFVAKRLAEPIGPSREAEFGMLEEGERLRIIATREIRAAQVIVGEGIAAVDRNGAGEIAQRRVGLVRRQFLARRLGQAQRRGAR